jgi:Phasin protein
MNTRLPEQIVAAQKVGLETLYGFFNTAFEGYEKLIALNLQAAKASILENEAVASEALAFSAKDPKSFSNCSPGSRKRPPRRRKLTGTT